MAVVPPPDDPRFVIQVTEEMIRHSRIRDILYFTGFAYTIVTLWVMLASGLSAKLRDLAARLAHRRFLISMIYGALFTVAAGVLQFPLAFYAGYVVSHQFNLSNQNFAQWLWDQIKELGVGMLLTAIATALVLFAIQRFRRWWLVVWLGSIPIMIFMVIIAPVFIDPIFNRFEPLKDQALKQRLLAEAARAGIEGGRVYEVDKSRQTRLLNAYVTGIGPTKRIVMWDTLLQKMSHDEVVAVMGHEMAHYVLDHVWKGLAFGIGVGLFVLFVTQRIYERGLDRWSIRERGDPASLPWLVMIISTLMFLLSPAINGYSRYLEHEADRFGLELTRLNEASATSLIKLAENAKVNPRPHPFIEFWRYSHPSIEKRVRFALEGRRQKAEAEGRGQRAEPQLRPSSAFCLLPSAFCLLPSYTLRAVSRSRSTSSSHKATENLASSCGSAASASDSAFLSQARTVTISSPAFTETVRGESSMKETSPRTSPGPTVATTAGRPSRVPTMSRWPSSTANSVESTSCARMRYPPSAMRFTSPIFSIFSRSLSVK